MQSRTFPKLDAMETAAVKRVFGDFARGVQLSSIKSMIGHSIGASGAIAGVMGAYFVLYPRSRVLTLVPLIIFWEVFEVPTIFLLGFWFLMQLFNAGAIAVTANTHQGGVAFAAHVVGFIAGMVAIFVFRKPEPRIWEA